MTIDKIKELLADLGAEQRFELAESTRTGTVLQAFSTDSDEKVRWTAITNPRADAEVWTEYINDVSPRIRNFVTKRLRI
ncbi:MAG: hypothetical protein LBL41_03100 [Bifidobacteriaceae bacterium]|jgi:hypothetical protein|nr:hypothetical protein [Bifidobacteriaceae bacterium]